MTNRNTFVPAVLDIEASCFGSGSYPIEVGFVLADQTTHCRLITPEQSWTRWDATAEALHGIGRGMLYEHGWPAKSVANWLNDHLAGKVVYSDAWSFDMSWLGKLFEFAQVRQKFAIESALTLLNQQQAEQWDDIKQKIVQTYDNQRHRASHDARIIQQTLLRLLETHA